MEAERQLKWDHRFMRIAQIVASWSKDPSTKCGAVIVRPDLSICSVGFNGFPRGCNDADEVYADRALKYERVVHAEVNAILAAPEPVRGYTLYSWPPGIGPSCSRCSATMVQAGIKRVVHYGEELNDLNSRWAPSINIGKDMFREAGVEVVTLTQPYRPEGRAAELLGVASRFIEEGCHEAQLISYDGAECDGGCLHDDMLNCKANLEKRP